MVYHVIFVCPQYKLLRSNWLNKVHLPTNFDLLCRNDQISNVLSEPCNVKPTAIFLQKIMDQRSVKVRKYDEIYTYHTAPPEQCLACICQTQGISPNM